MRAVQGLVSSAWRLKDLGVALRLASWAPSTALVLVTVLWEKPVALVEVPLATLILVLILNVEVGASHICLSPTFGQILVRLFIILFIIVKRISQQSSLLLQLVRAHLSSLAFLVAPAAVVLTAT